MSVFSVGVSKPLSVDTDLTVSIYTEQTPTRAAVKSEQVLCIETAAVDNGFFSDKEVGRVSADAFLHYGRPAAGSVTLLSIRLHKLDVLRVLPTTHTRYGIYVLSVLLFRSNNISYRLIPSLPN